MGEKQMGMAKFKGLNLALVLALAIVTYQNCSPVDFGAKTAASAAKSENPGQGDGLPADDETANNDDVAEDEGDSPAAYASGTGCLFGRNTKVIYDSLPVDTTAPDKSYQNIQGAFHQIDAARNLTLESIAGSISVKRAENLITGTDLQGAFHRLVSRQMGTIASLHSAFNLINTQKINRVLDIQNGGLKLTAHEVGDVEKIRGAFLCLNTQNVASITDVQGAFITISGRQENDIRGHIQELQNLHGAYVKIARFQIDHVADLQGNIHIKDAQIKKLEKISGNIIIENSEIESLSDHQGLIFLKNSKIINSSNVGSIIKTQ